MIRPVSARFVLVLLAASGLALAQTQPPSNPQQAPSAGGWRRVGDTPPQPAPAQDPTQPVDRSDAYGQPAQGDQQANPQGYPAGAPPQAAPQDYPQNAPPPTGQESAPPPRAGRPAYGLPPVVRLQPGTYVTIRTNGALSSDHNQPGDPFTGVLMQPLVVDGVVVANRGQSVYGRVAEAQKAHTNQSSRLGLELTGLTLADGTQVPIHSQLIGRQGTTAPAGQQVGTVAATTGAGAVIGGMAAWGTGAAIGAGVGAAAGMIGVMVTRNRPTVVYPETPLTFQIESPVEISTTNAPQAFRYVGPEDYQMPMNAGLQPRPRPVPMAPPAYYAPYPYYPYYWGPGVSVYWGPGYYWGRGYYGRYGRFGRWR